MCTTSKCYQSYLTECRNGLPVRFRSRGTGLELVTPARDYPDTRVPMIYARLDRPTGRLLLHFLQSGANGRREYFTVPAECLISPTVARLLELGRGRHALRPGKYLLLTDDFFATASVGLRATETTGQSPAIGQATRRAG